MCVCFMYVCMHVHTYVLMCLCVSAILTISVVCQNTRVTAIRYTASFAIVAVYC